MTTDQIHRASFTGEVKATSEDGDQGRVTALVSAYNTPYQMGFGLYHEIVPKAFGTATMRVPIYSGHDWTFGGLPLGHGDVNDATRGLRLRGEVYIGTEDGRRLFNAIKARALTEWSIAYRITQFEEVERAGKTIIRVLEAELLEVSSTLRGANPETRTLETAMASAPTADVDEIARRAGLDVGQGEPLDLTDPVVERVARVFAQAKRRPTPATTDSFASVFDRIRAHVEAAAVAPLNLQLTSAQTLAFLAAVSHPLKGGSTFITPPSHAPVTPSPYDLVRKIVHPEGHIKAGTVTRSGEATPTPWGTVAPSVGFAATGSPSPLARFPLEATTTGDVITDAGGGLEAILTALGDGTRQGIGGALYDAPGTVDEFYGVTEVAGVQTLAAAALAPELHLARAARMVHTAGFSGPLAVVGHPVVVTEVLTGRSVREEVPSVVAYLPTTHAAAGEYVLADWGALVDLFVQPTAITTSLDHSDNRLRGRVTSWLRPEPRRRGGSPPRRCS